MAPQQNTFSVISNGAGRTSGEPSKPPMTSKQAKKLYKLANKEPRRSKAEQRKWEKEKQDEIRKELEKERVAIKAKAARDRKKAKEEEARENRKRNGLPLFDCRPSQDTIARFVRGNGTNKKRDSSGEPVSESEAPSSASSTGQLLRCAPPPKAFPSITSPNLSLRKNPPVHSVAPAHAPSVNTESSVVAPPQSFSGRNPPTRNRTVVAGPVGPPPRPPTKSKPKPFLMPRTALPLLGTNRQQRVETKKIKHGPPKQERTQKGPAQQYACEQYSASRPPNGSLQAQSSPHLASPQRPLPRTPPPQLDCRQTPSPQMLQSEMPPPPRPLPQITTPLKNSPQKPPPSTHIIIQDCFDDFFPTASQLALELEDDDCEAISENGVQNVPKENSLAKDFEYRLEKDAGQQEAAAQTSVNSGVDRQLNRHSRTFPTGNQEKPWDIQPGPYSRQRDFQPHEPQSPARNGIRSPARPPHAPPAVSKNNALKTGAHHTIQPRNKTPTSYQKTPPGRRILEDISTNSPAVPQRPTATKSAPMFFDDSFPLICTQDLVMSSQEVLDIEYPTKADVQPSPGGGAVSAHTSPLIEMDLAAIDWDDDLDDF